MTIYYIDPTVAGAGAGTIDDPYKSYASIPGLVAGDSVLQKSGTTFGGSVTVGGSGSAGNFITFSAYGMGSKPVIDALGAVDASCILVSGRSYIKITGLDLTGASDYPGACVRVMNSSEIYVEGNLLHESWYGVRAENTTATPQTGLYIRNNTIQDTSDSWVLAIASDVSGGTYSNIQIKENELYRSGKTGISIQTQEPTTIVTAPFAVFNLQITDNTIDTTAAYGAFIKGVFSSTTAFGKNVVSGNVVRNTGYGGALDTHCLWFGGCQYFDIKRNQVSDTWGQTGVSVGSGVGIYVDVFTSAFASSYMKVRWNKLTNTGQGGTTSAVGGAGIYIYRGADVDVYSNIVYKCRNGIAVQGAASAPDCIRIKIYQNTVKDCDGTGAGAQIIAISQAKLTEIKNNILAGGKLGIYKQTSGGAVSSFSENNNCIYGQSLMAIGDGAGNTLTPGTGTAPNASDILADPLLDSNFTPMAGSPCRRSGAYLGFPGMTDHVRRRFRVPRPMGAIEPLPRVVLAKQKF